jgi:exodeoxyribonuclease V alpha subunit
VALTLLGLLRERGDLCVELERWAGQPLPLEEDAPELRVPEAAVLEAGLAGLDCVSNGDATAPIVLRDGRLYLWRYFAGERRLAEGLRRMLGQGEVTKLGERLGHARLVEMIRRENPPGDGIDWQSVAVYSALRHRLCVITGGPGTGKTTTVLRVLAALLEQDAALDVALAAPTGKAAARLSESMRGRLEDLPEDVRGRVPEQVQTLHRLLGYRPWDDRFRYHRGHPLPQRVVVVDEASMVHLELMAALVDALRSDARLILLGDADQLASVGAGAVLRELCTATDPERGFSAGFASEYAELTGQELEVEDERGPLGDASVRLRTSHRFGADSGIGRLAAAVRAMDADTALELLESDDVADVRIVAPGEVSGAGSALGKSDELLELFEQLEAPLRANTVEDALETIDQVQVLSALRRGPFGVEGLNPAIEERLRARGHRLQGRYYRARPVLVTQNDSATGLSNGDVGLVWPGNAGDELHLPSFGVNSPDDGADGGAEDSGEDSGPCEARTRAMPIARLPEHETCWALTVHKSQGSEYDKVWVVLPPGEHPILCAELLYTAITRARQHVTLIATEPALRCAIHRRTERASTLADALADREVEGAKPSTGV